jgi:hypothetical protein
MPVAGEKDWIPELCVDDIGQQALPRQRISVPGVVPEPARLNGGVLQLRDEQLLRDDVPLRGGLGKALSEPLFLFEAEHRVVACARRVAAKRFTIAAGIVGAVLPIVQHRELGERTVSQPAVDPKVGPRVECHRQPDGHVLVIGLVGGSAFGSELRRWEPVLRRQTGIVIGVAH